LGEHLLCKQGVVGSSPITSISGECERKVENCDGASFRSADGLRAVAFPGSGVGLCQGESGSGALLGAWVAISDRWLR
jgi:hypothetical protein